MIHSLGGRTYSKLQKPVPVSGSCLLPITPPMTGRKSRTTTSSGGLNSPIRACCLATLKGLSRKHITWLPLESVNHFLSSTLLSVFLCISLLLLHRYCLSSLHSILLPRILCPLWSSFPDACRKALVHSYPLSIP